MSTLSRPAAMRKRVWWRAAVAALFTNLCFLLGTVGGTLGSAAEPAPASEGGDAVFVPDFWDPNAPLAKPDLPQGKPIRFLTETDDPPFVFTLPDGTLGGFDIDLARALCETLGVPCTVQARGFETILPALKAGTGDAAIASMAITDAALRDVDFAGPYYRTPARFVARADAKITGIIPETLGTKRVAVQGGTAQEAYLATFFPGAILQRYGSVEEIRAALQSGAVDLAFGDGIVWARWLAGPEGTACCAFASGPYTESRFFGEGAGIAVRKGDALRAALDFALARLAANGRYADIYLKYFPVSPY